MRRGERTSSQEEVRIPIAPTLEHYGAQDVPDTERWTACKCPFHDDRHASASVNTDLQIFVCHSCEMKGNAAQIIMKVEGCDFQTAVESAAEYAGESSEGVLKQSRLRRRVPGQQGDLTRSRRYRRVGRGNGRDRRSREDDG